MITCQGIGNTILALPVLKAFKDTGADCDLVASDNGSAQLAALSGLAAEIHEWQEKDGWAANASRLSKILRIQKYDTAFALAPAGRRENLLLRFSGARKKKGWRSAHPWRLLSFWDSGMPFWDEKKHDLESNRILTGLSGEQVKSAVDSLRSVFRRSGSFPKQKTNKTVLGIQPFTKARFKCWSFEEVKNFMSALQARIPCEMLIFGAAFEEEELTKLAQEVGGCFVIAGRPWQEVVDCFNGLDGFIGIDSSMAHLAAVCGVPTCVLYGSTEPGRVSALGENVVILKSKNAHAGGYEFSKTYPKAGHLELRPEKALDAVLSFVSHLKNNFPESFFLEIRDLYPAENLGSGGRVLRI